MVAGVGVVVAGVDQLLTCNLQLHQDPSLASSPLRFCVSYVTCVSSCEVSA